MDKSMLIASGNTAKIYLHENKVIKVFNKELPHTEANYEAERQKFAYSCGLPVPKVLDVTRMDEMPAIIMEYAEGRSLGDIIFDDMSKAEYYMEIAVDTQRMIHMCNADTLEPMSDKLTRQIKAAGLLSDNQKDALLKRLNTFKIDNKLCHGDYHVFNVIYSNGDVTIIDWVDSSAGDIRADVYRSYLLYSQFSMELADLYLRLYCKKSGLLKEEVFIWAPIIAGARLAENVSSEKAERLIGIVNQYRW